MHGGHIFARFHFVKLLPLRGRLYAWRSHIRSVPLREFFFSAGSFGPSNGHPMGTHVGTPMGHPLFKKEIISSSREPQNKGLEPIPLQNWIPKLSLFEFATFLWEKGRGGVGEGRAHAVGGPDLAADIDLGSESFGLNYPRIYFLFLKARRAVMGPAKRGPIWAG